MDQTRAADFTHKMKAWINPPRPGRNKNPAVALLMGFLLGPVGVALYLRSLVDGGLCLVAVMLVMLLTGWSPEWVSAFMGAAWAVGRILYDNQPPARSKPVMAASPGPMPSESEIPAGAMT